MLVILSDLSEIMRKKIIMRQLFRLQFARILPLTRLNL
jgi:hypothetical protein